MYSSCKLTRSASAALLQLETADILPAASTEGFANKAMS